MAIKINKKTRRTPDVVTVWKQIGEPDAYGNLSYTTPVYAWVKYNDQQKLFVNLDGVEQRGRASIFCEKDVMAIGDVAFFGESLESSPSKGSFTVKDRRSISSFSGGRTEFRYVI
jgi:hypothetical protein